MKKELNWAVLGCGVIANEMAEELARLEVMISKFGYMGAVVIAAMYLGHSVLLVGGFGPYLAQGLVPVLKNAVDALSLAVVIVVCAVPEGLPLMISLVLMQNTSKMLDHNVLVSWTSTPPPRACWTWPSARTASPCSTARAMLSAATPQIRL